MVFARRGHEGADCSIGAGGIKRHALVGIHRATRPHRLAPGEPGQRILSSMTAAVAGGSFTTQARSSNATGCQAPSHAPSALIMAPPSDSPEVAATSPLGEVRRS